MRGYFAIGAERISKPMNFGNLLRSAHAFGAKFFFTLNAHPRAFEAKSDTSKAVLHLPVFHWQGADRIALPERCRLVGIELIEGATELPAFRHPIHAAYILGPEKGVLSDAVLARCDHVVKIPTVFCINVAMAGAIVMYDRVRSLGPYPARDSEPSRLTRMQTAKSGPKTKI